MPNEGKVLKIIDAYTLVVSLGSADVTKGEKLIVYSWGDEIRDGATSLGRLMIIKGRVEVDYIQEKFSTAVSPLVSEQVYESTPSTYGISTYFTGSTTQRTRTETRRDPLPLAETPPSGIDKQIRVGDLVKKES